MLPLPSVLSGNLALWRELHTIATVGGCLVMAYVGLCRILFWVTALKNAKCSQQESRCGVRRGFRSLAHAAGFAVFGLYWVLAALIFICILVMKLLFQGFVIAYGNKE